jgi:hypothetical protein
LANSKLADKGSPNGKCGFLADNFRNARGRRTVLDLKSPWAEQALNIDRGFRFADALPSNEPATPD